MWDSSLKCLDIFCSISYPDQPMFTKLCQTFAHKCAEQLLMFCPVRVGFHSNTDKNRVVTHDLRPPFMAKYIRFRPVAWEFRIAMRVELYGCKGIT